MRVITASKPAPMLLDQLRQQRTAIRQACQLHGGRRIRVFGSMARREERADSDVDFLVDLPRGYDLFGQRIPLQRQLAEITGRPTDLIPEHELSPLIRDRVLREAVEL